MTCSVARIEVGPLIDLDLKDLTILNSIIGPAQDMVKGACADGLATRVGALTGGVKRQGRGSSCELRVYDPSKGVARHVQALTEC